MSSYGSDFETDSAAGSSRAPNETPLMDCIDESSKEKPASPINEEILELPQHSVIESQKNISEAAMPGEQSTEQPDLNADSNNEPEQIDKKTHLTSE